MSTVHLLTRCSPLVVLAALLGRASLVPGAALALGIGDFVEVGDVGPAGLPSSDGPCGAPAGHRSEGDVGEVIGGPGSCAGRPHWRVHWSGDGRIGWSAAAALRKVACSDRDRDGCLQSCTLVKMAQWNLQTRSGVPVACKGSERIEFGSDGHLRTCMRPAGTLNVPAGQTSEGRPLTCPPDQPIFVDAAGRIESCGWPPPK